MRHIGTRLAVIVLVLGHCFVLFAGFFAPYSYAEQNRHFPYAPPARLHLTIRDASVQIFVYQLKTRPTGDYYQDLDNTLPVKFFVHGVRYPVCNSFFPRWTSDLHLFGTEYSQKIFLLGSDAYGRDQLSRLLFGGRISLFSGLLAALASLTLGSILGAIAGLGGLVDAIIMRLAEIVLAVPALYLLFAVRALLPLHLAPEQVFVVLVTIIGVVGWARPARLIRGVVLSVKESEFVLAARGFGATDFYLMRRHIFPQVLGVVLTQAAVLIPQYMLAEITLSFVGLGMNEPVPSWGNMLAPLQQFSVLDSDWWMFAPACAAFPVALAYYTLSLEYGREKVSSRYPDQIGNR